MSYITYFARANFRERGQVFGIKLRDRYFHFYVLGKSGSGKTTLLKTKIFQDITHNHSLFFLDPHGDAIRDIYQTLYDHHKKKVIYLDFTNPDLSWGYNPIKRVPSFKRSLVASSILEVFKRMWKSAWGMKMEHILRMVLLTLLDQPQADFSHINRLLQDTDYRNTCKQYIQSKVVKDFWEREFPKYKPNDLLPIQSKTGAFLSHPIIHKLLIENNKQLSIRKAMDSHRVVLINLAKGSIGVDVANTIGGLLMTSIASAAFSRIDIPEHKRLPCFIYADEFQNFSNTELLSEMLSELRKFHCGLVLANQYLLQLDPDVKNAILGNVGTVVCFRLGITDAKIMQQEFYPVFTALDFISLKNASIYLKLMIDGKPSVPFSADTIL